MSRFSSVAAALSLALVACATPPPCAPPPSAACEDGHHCCAQANAATHPEAEAKKPVADDSTGDALQGVFHSVVRKENHRIEFGPYAFEVDAMDGGRITTFSLDGKSVVLPKSESPSAYGSSFWPSPQQDWNWPPPPELDALPWAVTTDARSLSLKSQTHAALGISATQRFSIDETKEALTTVFSLKNEGTEARSIAPWQNTRVRPKGLTFFPSSGPGYEQSTLKLAPQNGIIWHQHDPEAQKKSEKLFADGLEGWLAHVDSDLLFLKLFPDVPKDQQAPTEAEIEIYVHDSGSFVEVEQQGPYEELAPGAESDWTVHWLVRRLPKGVSVRVGSDTLLAFTRELARTFHAR